MKSAIEIRLKIVSKSENLEHSVFWHVLNYGCALAFGSQKYIKVSLSRMCLIATLFFFLLNTAKLLIALLFLDTGSTGSTCRIQEGDLTCNMFIY